MDYSRLKYYIGIIYALADFIFILEEHLHILVPHLWCHVGDDNLA
jgi:hypothetical protein